MSILAIIRLRPDALERRDDNVSISFHDESSKPGELMQVLIDSSSPRGNTGVRIHLTPAEALALAEAITQNVKEPAHV